MKRIAIIVILLLTSIWIGHSSVVSYGNEQFDKGAMSIINQLVEGKNISYVALGKNSTVKEFFIELNAEEPEWFKHEDKDTQCAICHKYDTKYLTKGGGTK